MSNVNRTKYLLKNTTIFAISNMATKLITFFLVPLYTYCLNTEEYGVIDMFFTISSVLIPIVTLNVVEAIYRFSMDRDAENNKIVSIGIILFILCIILSLFLFPMLDLFPIYSKYKFYYYFYIVTSAGYQIFAVNLKGQEKLKLFSIGNIINTFLVAFLNILFLKVFNFKIEGYFLAYIISNSICLIYAIIAGNIINIIKNFSFDKNLFKDMCKYSIVLIPTSFMWWIMKASDRIMLTHYSGLALNGIYAISYKIPTILQSIAAIFNQAWVFSAVKEKDSEDKNQYTNLIFRKLYFGLCIISCFLLVFLKPFFSIYISKEYFTAWKYVPVLLIGTLFITFGTFLSSSYNVHKDSKGFLFSGLYGTLVNIILNFILIPKFSAFGAAIATCISYIVVFIYRLIDTQKYVKISFYRDYVYAMIIIVLLSILIYFDNFISIIVQLCFLIFFLIFSRNEWLIFFNSFLSRIRKKERRSK